MTLAHLTHRRLYTMASFRRYRFLLTFMALFTTAVAVVTPSVAQASSKNPTTTSVLNAAKTALSKQVGVHVTVNSKSGAVASNVVVDIGSTSGSEVITSGKSVIKISVTPTYAYLSGSSVGLTTIMGLTAAQSKKVGSLSITMKAGTAPYSNFKANLTSTVLVAMLPATKGTVLSTTGTNGSKVYKLSWTTKATSSRPTTKSVLTLSSDKVTLPIKEVITSSAGGGTTTFSKWGEQVKVDVPSSASTIAYAKVFG